MCCGMGCCYESWDGGCRRPAGSPCAMDDDALAEYEARCDDQIDRMVKEMREQYYAANSD